MSITEIRCPTCRKTGGIELSEEFMKNISRGIMAVNVPSKIICDHSFIAYVDKNLLVRDYFTVDFHIELPELDLASKIEGFEIPSSDVVDIELIKMNISPYTLSYIIRSCIFHNKMLILIEETFLQNHLKNLLKFIFKHSFELDTFIEKTLFYKENKKSLKEHVVFDEGGLVIKDKNNILSKKKINIEKVIIKKFILEYQAEPSLIILKNEILKAFELGKKLSKKIKNLLKNNEIDEMNRKKLLKDLVEDKNVKISLPYLKFLIEIVENYFKVNVPPAWKFFLYRV